ncbi:ribonuclease P protein subunit p30 [Episyrphus balteatus]|uniref:ribonuclease P protein subunit p30 n=1 Tax=Episyrphus balteatus TaxID=286459 RepID=UPI0024853CF1|nr:ribonuclease P protein subunit p30 [Episyrphus balteatus]
MEKTKGFYDLCVPFNKDAKVMKSLVKELIELGYKTIAIEETFDHSKKDLVKRGSELFPEPANLSFLNEFKNQIKILSRLTIIYVDVSVSHAMTNSTNIKKYNIIAGLPKNDVALTHCCTTFNGDIVTFDPEGGKLLVNRKNYQVAVKRGVFFEIKYSPVITNSSCRKDTIKLTHNYHAKGKSKSIILSSSAKCTFDLRGPYDVSNLALIFGLSEDQGKNAIGSTCRQLVLRAESRRIGKTIMFAKGAGPICLSSSSSESSSEEEEDDENKNEDVNDDDDDMNEQQPNKKKKLS